MYRPWLVVWLVVSSAFGLSLTEAAAPRKPEQAVKSPKDQKIVDLIRALGGDTFAGREAAQGELVRVGEPARRLLRQALKSTDDLEVRRRVREVLRQLDLQAELRVRAERRAARKLARPPSFDPAVVRATVDKQGVIASDETWTPANSYRITGALRVRKGATLHVEAGAVVLVAGNFDVEVEKGAALEARSDDPRKPIIFTALAEKEGKQGHWGRLVGLGRMSLKNVQVRRSSGVRAGRDSNPYFDELGVYHTRGDALTFDQCNGEQGRVVVRQASGVGIAFPRNPTYPHFQEVIVSHCRVGMSWAVHANSKALDATVHHCRTGLFVTGQSYPFFLRLTVADCAKEGIVIEDASYPAIKEVVLEDIAGVGIAVKGNSYPAFDFVDSTIHVKLGQQIEPESRVRPWDRHTVSRETQLWLEQQSKRKGQLGGLPDD